MTRALASVGAAATSWKTCGDRTYATLAIDVEPHARTQAAVDFESLANLAADACGANARLAELPYLVVRIVPDAPRVLPALAAALGGPGRPAGVRDVLALGDAIVVECDGALTSLATLVALVDCELASAPGRTIEPLVAFDDATLSAFVGHVLREPELEPGRLIETHLAAFASGAIG